MYPVYTRGIVYAIDSNFFIMENVDVLVIGGGTAGSNAARTAKKEGAQKVVMVHLEDLTNTCVEEGCMPSKSILAGAHQH